MHKKRVLFVNEFSGLSTGFATYGHYVIPELYKTGKYEIAEIGVYASKAHPKIGNVPWKVYPNEPDPNNVEEQKIYAQNKINQFGLWIFNEAALDFKPDFTISISDIWMNEWIHQTPYRNNFKHLQMVTCDGEPQKDEWLRSYKNNDVLLTYSYWAKNLIERVSNGRTKVRDVASPGTDINIFRPQDKVKLRERFGIKGDVFIIQTVMRNQPRKLFPELMKAFNAFLELCRANGRDDIAQKTYLHLHTTNPDMGWDLPKEIRNHGLGHKVIFTYMCDACKTFYPSFYQGDRTICRHCHQSSLRLPNTAIGLEREQLADIMAIPDLYVQYSCSEGWGMCMNDAKGCGIPIMAVENSAMWEQAHAPGGIPIPVKVHAQECITQTNQLRAIPDNEATTQLFYKFFTATPEYRAKLGQEARDWVVKQYSWPNIAKIWEDIIDETPILDRSQTWDAPPYIIKNLAMPNQQLSNIDFVKWVLVDVLHKPRMFHDVGGRFAQILDQGFEPQPLEDGRMMYKPYNRENFIQFIVGQINQNNMLESMRCGLNQTTSKVVKI